MTVETTVDEYVEEPSELAQLAADVVVLARHEDVLYVLLIVRGWDPDEDLLALAGGHLNPGEDDKDTARREGLEETGVDAGDRLTEVGVYRKPGRDPRGRYCSFAWMVELDELVPPVAGSDARHVQWVPVDVALAHPELLAFDHHTILTDAAAKLASPAAR